MGKRPPRFPHFEFTIVAMDQARAVRAERFQQAIELAPKQFIEDLVRSGNLDDELEADFDDLFEEELWDDPPSSR